MRATLRSVVPGKPPVRHYFVDLHITNPLPSPIWLFLDARDIPDNLSEADLWHTSQPAPGYFWTLSGSRSTDALRIPDRADLLVRNVELSTLQHEEAIPLLFASELRIANRPAPEWLGQEGMNRARGEFTLAGESLVVERRVESLEHVPVSFHVICITTVDLRAGVLPGD